MKKCSILFFLMMLSLMTRTVIFANDGSLQIDTSLDKNTEKTELHYFEQEGDLIKLFRPETEKRIATLQGEDKERYQETKTGLFVTEVTKENSINSYQSLLFTSQTIVTSRDNYGVALNEKQEVLSWPAILLFLIALSVMLFSVFRKKNTKPVMNLSQLSMR